MIRPIPQRTLESYLQFVEFANPGDALNSFDLARFYDFVWAAHAYRATFNEHDLNTRLLEDGFEDEIAEELASIYKHCRDFMKARRTAP